MNRYFRHGGAPDQVIELLSENYMGIAQTATLMADWLIATGVEASDVVNMIVQPLKTLIEKHFELEKADSIFEAGGVSVTVRLILANQSDYFNRFHHG